MYAVFKLHGKVYLDYCFMAQDGLYHFMKEDPDLQKDRMYFIHKKNILGTGQNKQELKLKFAEHFI